MNDLLFRIENESCYTEVRSTEKGYKLISFMPERGRMETNYYDNKLFSKSTKWSADMLIKHSEFEAAGMIESIEDMESKIDLMPGLLEYDESIGETLKEVYLKKGQINPGIIIQFKFVKDFPEDHKGLFVSLIVDSIIKNTKGLKELDGNVKQLEIQILR